MQTSSFSFSTHSTEKYQRRIFEWPNYKLEKVLKKKYGYNSGKEIYLQCLICRSGYIKEARVMGMDTNLVQLIAYTTGTISAGQAGLLPTDVPGNHRWRADHMLNITTGISVNSWHGASASKR